MSDERGPRDGLVRPPLRERKRQAARHVLFETAYRKFLEKGFDRTTVAEIADAADLSPRTFFRYFGSKEEVVFAQSDSHLAVVRDSLLHRPIDEPVYRSVEGVLLEYAQYLDRNRDWVVPLGRLVLDTPELQAKRADEYGRWARGVADALAGRRGDAESSFEDEAVAAAGLAGFTTAFDRWIKTDGSGTLQDQVERAFKILALG